MQALRAAGCEPKDVGGAFCCGQPAYNSGFAKEARRVAKPTLRAVSKASSGDCVVASGSCAAMMSHYWPELFAGTPQAAEARRVAERTKELTVYVSSRLESEPVNDAPQAESAAEVHPPLAEEPVVIHDACHALRGLGAAEATRRALAASGRRYVNPPGSERCCGFGGLFSVKMPDVSVAMADEKLDLLASTGCETVVSCDLSCLVHLEGRAGRRGLALRFEHAASLLEGIGPGAGK